MANTSYNELFQKIRIGFLFNHPFLSVLTLSLKNEFVQNSNSAFETDGYKISIDIDKLSKYSEDEITYLYAHTLMHIVLKHPLRQNTRDSYLWNQSCNLVVNQILSTFDNIGKAPDDEIIDDGIKDMCVEEVYEMLDKETPKEEEYTTPKDGGDAQAHIYDQTKMDIREVQNNQKGQNEQNLDSIIIQALSIAKKSPHLYDGMQIEINEIIKPNISLKDILKEYLISSLFEKTSTYDRPNRKFIHQNLYLPGFKKSDEMVEVYIALDSSGSVSLDEYKSFLGVVFDICEDFYEYRVTVLPFDSRVKVDSIITLDSLNPFDKESVYIPKSDGGTDFDEVLRYLATTHIKPKNLLIVLTDGLFDISESMVCNTLFVLSNPRYIQKFEKYGRVIQFNL
jgi:predicted metal-dependent peptidase